MGWGFFASFQTAEDFGNHPFRQRIFFAVSLFLQCLKRDFLRFGNGRAGDPKMQIPENLIACSCLAFLENVFLENLTHLQIH